jgi:hypothetical protein
MIIDVPGTREVDPYAPATSAASGDGGQGMIGAERRTATEESRSPLGGSARLWLLMTPDGQTYGPVERAELDQWAREGRVSTACKVRREIDFDWRPAADIFPHLDPKTPTVSIGPVADQITAPYHAAGYRSPAARTGRGLTPNNGVTVLVFGILGAVCPFFSIIFAIIAIIMGASDLAAIRRGEMDPRGRGLVMAGLILGIIFAATWAIGLGGCVIIGAFR